MQTFLPYSDFEKSISCLDSKRLGKQRVEAYQILEIVSGNRTSGGFVNHPIVHMWKGYSRALSYYMNICISKWIERGFRNNMKIIRLESRNIEFPDWFGDERLHSSHRANLLRKDYEFYSKYGWEENDMNYDKMPYWWGEKYGYGNIPEEKKVVGHEIKYAFIDEKKEWIPKKWKILLKRRS